MESADHVISGPQVLHCFLLRSRPMSFRIWIATDCSRKGTSERTGSDHRHPSAPDVRMRTSVLIHTSAIVLRIPKSTEQLYHYYICERYKTIDTTRETNSTQLEDKVCCIVGVSLETWWVAGREKWKPEARKRRQQRHTQGWAKDRSPVTAV